MCKHECCEATNVFDEGCLELFTKEKTCRLVTNLTLLFGLSLHNYRRRDSNYWSIYSNN